MCPNSLEYIWNFSSVFGSDHILCKKKGCNFKLKMSGWCTTTLAPTLIPTRPLVQILKKPGTTNCSELAITRVILVEKNHLDFSPKKKPI